MVMPRSRSSSMSSRNCSDISRAETAPVRSSRRSASVDFPWSMCAMIEKLRMRGVSRTGRMYGRRGCRATDAPSTLRDPRSGAARPRPEPLDGAPEAVGQRHLRPPAEDLAGAPAIDHAPALLALLCRSVTDLGAAARGLEEEARERVHVGLDAGADVEGSGRGRLEREEVGARHVADVDVVAGLLAVAVHRDRLGAEHPAREDRDHARLAVRVLA